MSQQQLQAIVEMLRSQPVVKPDASVQEARAGFELDTALEGADYAAVARAFGCHGETVTNAAEIRPALDRALASGLPAVVDVQTRFVPHPALPRFAAMGRL